MPSFLGSTQDCVSNPSAPSCASANVAQQQQQQDLNLNGQQTLPASGLGQRPASNNSLYVDQAGTDDNASRAGQRNALQQKFPPDPPTDLQRLARSATGETLPVFGRDLFQNVPSTFAPGDQIAVPADYIVGPGDEVLLRIWGPEAFNSQLTVDRSGSIYVPKVGAIHVAGLRFDDLQQQITASVNRVYRNYNLTVNLGRLRSIQIYVVGEARQPGAYTVSSLSTVLNALFASGGPSVRGSMRHIQIRRGSTVLPEFDLYDLVLRGDKTRDTHLEAGDTIFIPAVGPQIALGGSVRHPALYELKADSTLQDVLDLAGGFSAVGTGLNLTLDRIGEDHVRHTMNVGADAAGRAMALRDGDVLYAGHISAGYEETITIRGNLANPGRFAWHQGMRLNEIIPDRMSLLTNNYWRERNRLGVPVPLFEPLYPAQNAQDQTLYPETNGTLGNGQILRNGQIQRQLPQNNGYGTRSESPYEDTNQRETDLQQDGVLGRTSSEDARLIGQVGPAVTGVITPQDTVPSGNTAGSQAVYGTTSGSASRRLSLPQATAADNTPVNRIQIPAPEINWTYAVIERLDPNTLKSSLVPFNLGRLVQEHDASQDLELQPGDVVTILSQKDVPVSLDAQTKFIRLEGEFASPGVYSTQPGETLAQLVRRAGGFTPKAYLFGSSFLRESARVFQQQRLDEYISHLSTDMQRALAVRAVSSSTGVLDPTSLAEQQNLINQLRQMRATGRVVLAFQPESAGLEAIPDFTLENGDVFRVPSVPGTISVIGAVYGQNVFLYNPKSRMENYLALAGRPNRIADKKSAFIIRADGSIFSREQANTVFSNKFDNARINPGDSIVIPEKLIRPTALRQLIDYSQILSSFGLAAAAINVIR
ncbi:MAG: SLBB domain-containing protein [Janthinobacterium lividum]